MVDFLNLRVLESVFLLSSVINVNRAVSNLIIYMVWLGMTREL